MLSKFSINQRMIVLVALAGSIAGLIAIALWTQQPDMQVLFTNLNPEDAAGIVDKLKETKVPYETTGGGNTILVPSAQVHEMRLQLATQGLPHGGGVGFEIFDRSSIGMSDFVQKLNYRRALQGELARTIAQMPEIERARVHLATPERRLFSNDENRARASVVLSLRNGQALAKTQVNGIVHLVSSSVEGLQVKDVTVVDGHGRLLSSAAGSDDAAGLTGSQLEYQRTVEKDIETRIQTMLERIVGANKAVVRVSSILDFRKVETTEERYDPNSQVVRSEQRGQEKANGVNGVSSGGVPGVQSNVPSGVSSNVPDVAGQEPVQTSSNNNQTKNETVNYEISRTVSRVVEPSGSIKQLSVAVLVDGIYETAAPSEAGKAVSDTAKKYAARPEEDMKRIEEIVKKAMGYSAERQDQVQVTNVQFDIATEEPPGQGVEAAAETASSFTPSIRYGVGGALFFLILFMVVRPLMAMLGPASSSADGSTPPLPASVSQVEASLTGKPRSQIVDMARGNPDNTALVVKQWLKTS